MPLGQQQIKEHGGVHATRHLHELQEAEASSLRIGAGLLGTARGTGQEWTLAVGGQGHRRREASGPCGGRATAGV